MTRAQDFEYFFSMDTLIRPEDSELVQWLIENKLTKHETVGGFEFVRQREDEPGTLKAALFYGEMRKPTADILIEAITLLNGMLRVAYWQEKNDDTQ